MKTKRPSPAWIALLLAMLLLAACGTPAASPSPAAPSDTAAAAEGEFVCPPKVEGIDVTSDTLNLFVWTEYIPEDTIRCFEEVYGITVNHSEYSSNEELYAKLNAGGGNYDIIQPTDYIIPLMIRQGLVQELDHAKLPILADLNPGYLDLTFDPGNKYSIPYQSGTDAIVVNTDAVETIPQSWADLWNPEYAGNLIMLDDSRAVIGATLLSLGYDLNTVDEAELEEAAVKLRELVANVAMFDSDSPKSALIAGDADLGMTWTAEALLAQQENPAIEYIYPTEGAIRWQDNYLIPADAPNADAAYAWINYTMQPALFWQMLRDFPYNNPSDATLAYAKENQTELYDAYMASNITNPPAEVLEAGHYMMDVGDATPLYDRIWTEAKGQ
jgi:spermidine/putrescine-binding protein